MLEALRKTGREDLIGYGKHCLVKPDSRDLTQGARDIVRDTGDAIGDIGRGIGDAARDLTGMGNANYLATCMWYTGLDPRTMKPVFVPRTPHDKALQRALMQWRKPQNRALVLEAFL